MKKIKSVVAMVMMVMFCFANPVLALSVVDSTPDWGLVGKYSTWEQEVQVRNVLDSGALHLTIYMSNLNNISVEQMLTATVTNEYGVILGIEYVTYDDVGSQSITFTWDNSIILQEGDSYKFSLTGSSDVAEHALHLASWNAYPEGNLYYHDNITFNVTDMGQDMVFDNHLVKVLLVEEEDPTDPVDPVDVNSTDVSVVCLSNSSSINSYLNKIEAFENKVADDIEKEKISEDCGLAILQMLSDIKTVIDNISIEKKGKGKK